ncbi:MAG: hypothetical protein IPK03_04695 [Bacteroidetes bacterium]|nr:hypothetical protein [Bacteroidota bacterium]
MRHKILFIPILSIQISLLAALFLVNACQSGNSNKEIDSPTAGKSISLLTRPINPSSIVN